MCCGFKIHLRAAHFSLEKMISVCSFRESEYSCTFTCRLTDTCTCTLCTLCTDLLHMYTMYKVHVHVHLTKSPSSYILYTNHVHVHVHNIIHVYTVHVCTVPHVKQRSSSCQGDCPPSLLFLRLSHSLLLPLILTWMRHRTYQRQHCTSEPAGGLPCHSPVDTLPAAS